MLLRTFRVNYLLNSYKNLGNITRTVSSSPVSFGIFGPPAVESLPKRIARKFGWNEHSKGRLTFAGYKLYIKIDNEVNFMDYFEICELDDTFMSWFRVVELHIWLLSARLMEEGSDGKVVRNSMIRALWDDVDVRSKKLEGYLPSARREQIQELNDSFQASLLSYDEGLLGNDKILAGALWRRFLQAKEPTSQEELLKQIVALEMLVLFVRSQYKELSSLSRQQILLRPNFKFHRFHKDIFTIAKQTT